VQLYSKICAHALVVAELRNCLLDFVAWYKRSKHKPSAGKLSDLTKPKHSGVGAISALSPVEHPPLLHSPPQGGVETGTLNQVSYLVEPGSLNQVSYIVEPGSLNQVSYLVEPGTLTK
jgi:hypothetical protein